MQFKEKLQLFLKDYLHQLFRETEKLMLLPMPELTEELFVQYEQFGNRAVYENVYFARRKFLMVFSLKAIWEQKQAGRVSDRILTKLSEVIREICREECWAVPAHLSRKNPDWRITIDLFAAETAQTLSELADRLRNDFSQELCDLIRENVEKRVLIPFVTSDQYGWEKSDHNWNAVCTGAIGSACIHLWGEGERTDLCLQRVCDSLLYYLDGFADDGTCLEGCGYYTYGMSYFVNFANELSAYSKGKTDLLRGDWGHFRKGEKDKRSRIAAFQSKCFFADGTVVNFSDGNSRDKFSMGLNLALKNHFTDVQVPDISAAAGLLHDHCFRFVFRKLDLLETEQYLESLPYGENHQSLSDEKTVTNVLPDAQWCIANAKNGIGFACKGGHNGEPHNHNDVGHFIYEANGTAFLADLGAGEYTRDYFGEKRYEILCNHSFGHSVPIVDGKGQPVGKDSACEEFTAEEKQDSLAIRMDLSGAYGEEQGTISRKLEFNLLDGRLKVTDMFSFAENKAVTENLITQCTPVLNGNRVLLTGNAGIAEVTVHNTQSLSVKAYAHRNHSGEPEPVYAIRWLVSSKEKNAIFEIKMIDS